MKVHFLLRFHTQFGQSLSVCGNTSALGNNQPQQALLMNFLDNDFWQASIEVDEELQDTLHYYYIFTTENGDVIEEAEKHRTVFLPKIIENSIQLIDTWNDQSTYENVFYSTPFQSVLLPKQSGAKQKKASLFTHIFKVKAPLLAQHEAIFISGDGEALNNWQKDQPLLLEKEGDWWIGKINLEESQFPIAYKYGVYHTKAESFVRFESGDNRLLTFPAVHDTLTIVHDAFVHLPNNTWRGAGVAIPVFSLKSKNSFGVGEFADLKLLADWSAKAGLKLIQILPINDTSATFTYKDSYPYAAISAFALHPIYCNLSKVAGKKYADHLRSLLKKQKQLNSLPELDYEQVIHFKLGALRELYELQGNEFFSENNYEDFFKDNQHWLVPYAAFCYFRDRYKTADFSKWPTNSLYNEAEVKRISTRRSKCFKQIAFHYFVQYHLHLQLKEATAYCHKKGLVVKGDIAIGIARHSCDAWTAPKLYNMDQQAGAPPDDFAVRGQNWGFPTYNWQQMQQDDFDWWKKRFQQMSHYFDAFRIDHILGFFRIWSIPIDAVEGIMGVFKPALPIAASEFSERSIWLDEARFCQPFITEGILHHLFGNEYENVKSTFLQTDENGNYRFKEEYNTQRKVEYYFSDKEQTDENKNSKRGLFELLSNVILFKDDTVKDAYHFRISIEATSSFQYLDDATKQRLWPLYIDYFYHRQDDFWKKEALRKLPYLKAATHMLICGEDLGMVPHCVPEVMKRLGILSLEIQRMPKNTATQFFHPATAPYLSVITPSTHDMSTIRGWWEENRHNTQIFFNTVLEEGGDAPFFCEAWINRAVVLQHLYSPAMWSIFQLQDLLGMSERLRREKPQEERINQPADPNHYWRYRMHLTLEDLMGEKEFTAELKDYIEHSGRS